MEQKVDAAPAKRFFVEMLTRDIDLKDSILDLLDNCIDGVMRSNRDALGGTKPYSGFKAEINFSKDGFQIIDNCGGIPRGIALERAFRMGRPDKDTDKDIPTVGVYGIGMKRAIFKMGRNAVVQSKTAEGGYKVDITSSWLDDDHEWNLPIAVDSVNDVLEMGTKIVVSELYPGISRLLSNATGFVSDLIKSISAYYGGIILKGFEVLVNGEVVKPLAASFILNEQSLKTGKGVAPYVYKGSYNGVSIELAVGFYRGLPTDQEQEDSLSGKPSTEHAGWTLICNDRVILHADKTKVTGWGEAGVPQYHTQFVSIAGIVSFRSNDASLLPLTTTKRGVDGNSEMYLSVKEFMREGLKLFTDYTNKWKGPEHERPELGAPAVTASASEIVSMVGGSLWSQDRKSVIKGSKFKPDLPMPPVDKDYRFLRFSRPLSEIRQLGEYYFDDPNYPPGEIGAFCFDEALKEANK